MEINMNSKVGEIVRLNFTTARIFEARNIDFCCGGNISLREAASREGLKLDRLLEELNAALKTHDRDAMEIEVLSLTELADHIEKVHHSYVNETMPFLISKLQKLCDVHGENHPELYTLKASFDGAVANLSVHMKKEELVLFPYIRKMEKYYLKKGEKPSQIGVALPAIRVMEEEHKTEGDRFSKIAESTNKYTVPPDGCSTYEVTYRTLEEFEKDLHRHIHLENNVLFPKAIDLEQLISKQQN